jgi:hypothetical protein
MSYQKTIRNAIIKKISEAASYTDFVLNHELYKDYITTENVNKPSINDSTFLHYTAQKLNYEFTRYCLDIGANVVNQDNKLILGNSNRTIFEWADYQKENFEDSNKFCTFLVEYYTEKDNKEMADLIDKLYKHYVMSNKIHDAWRNNDFTTVETILNSGFELFQKERTAYVIHDKTKTTYCGVDGGFFGKPKHNLFLNGINYEKLSDIKRYSFLLNYYMETSNDECVKVLNKIFLLKK